MKKIQNITSEHIQTHIVQFNEAEVTVVLKYYELTQHWTIDVEYKGKSSKGHKLSLSVLHMRSANFPFDFTVEGTEGIDPFRENDFESGRCVLYMLDADEMQSIRGLPVEI